MKIVQYLITSLSTKYMITDSTIIQAFQIMHHYWRIVHHYSRFVYHYSSMLHYSVMYYYMGMQHYLAIMHKC